MRNGPDGTGPDLQEARGFGAESDLRAIDAVDARVSAGGATGGHNVATGKEAKLHEATAKVGLDIKRFEDCGLPATEINERTEILHRGGAGGMGLLVESQLHSTPG